MYTSPNEIAPFQIARGCPPPPEVRRAAGFFVFLDFPGLRAFLAFAITVSS
jgi:hypothetical protein